MYEVIRNKESFTNIYIKDLIDRGIINEKFIENLQENYNKELENEFKLTDSYNPTNKFFENNWKYIKQADDVTKIPET
jgi:2-oxoglutarate dehydrogenase complex dehydrogenase (E1) component-like enzyme